MGRFIFIFLFIASFQFAFAGEGFISVVCENGRFLFVDGNGNKFISKGINHVNRKQDKDAKTGRDIYNETILKKYGNYDEWGKSASLRMREIGFNTLGGWCSLDYLKDLYFITIIYPGKNNWDTGGIDDYFSVEFAEDADKKAQKEIVDKKMGDNKNLIGYCIGNELRWGIDWRGNKSIVFDYLNLSEKCAGKIAAIDYLRAFYNDDVAAFSREWGVSLKNWDAARKFTKFSFYFHSAKKAHDGLLYRIAEKYYQVTTDAVRKYDRNHLILGSRFVSAASPRPVVEAAGKYCDVLTVNYYELIFGLHQTIPDLLGTTSTKNILEEFYKISGKPVLITEMGVRGITHNNKSTKPFIYPAYFSQRSRAAKFEKTIRDYFEKKYIIGYHIFQWTDQPYNGRSQPDRENNNWGIVDIYDEVYQELAVVLKRVNGEFESF